MRFQGPAGLHSAFQASKRYTERPCLKTKILKPKPKSECIEQLRCGIQQVPRQAFINKHLFEHLLYTPDYFCVGKVEFLNWDSPHLLCCPSPLPCPILNSCRDHTHVTLATWASRERKEVALRPRPSSPGLTLTSGCSSHRKICRLLAMVVVR